MMSMYEIADLRNSLAQRIDNLIRTWLTVTFATFTAAFAGGELLDWITLAALWIFQGYISWGVWARGRRILRQIFSLVEMAQELERLAVAEGRKHIYSPATSYGRISEKWGAVFYALTFAALILFSLVQAGKLGFA